MSREYRIIEMKNGEYMVETRDVCVFGWLFGTRWWHDHSEGGYRYKTIDTAREEIRGWQHAANGRKRVRVVE